MTWNYRIIKNKEGYCDLCEVYYNENGEICGYTEPLMTLENKREIMNDLKLMLKDCQHQKILNIKTMKIHKPDWEKDNMQSMPINKFIKELKKSRKSSKS